MSMYEPAWMRSISSNTVCTFFFVLFLLLAAGAGITVLLDLLVIFQSGGKQGWRLLMTSVLMMTLPVVNALFMYILCARSLLERS